MEGLLNGYFVFINKSNTNVHMAFIKLNLINVFLQCSKKASGSAGVCSQKAQGTYSFQTQAIEESYRGKNTTTYNNIAFYLI